MIGPEWSDDEDDLLVNGINSGRSYREIAAAISAKRPTEWAVTRNAVAGRKHRLIERGREMKKPDSVMITTHGNKQRAKAKQRKEKVMKKIIAPAPAPQAVRLRNPTTGQLKPLRPGVLPMVEGAKPITELGYRQCRAAVGEPPKMYDGVNNPFLFCAAPTQEGETYCDDHAFLMYAKPKPKSERGFLLGRIGTNKGAA